MVPPKKGTHYEKHANMIKMESFCKIVLIKLRQLYGNQGEESPMKQD